MLDQISAWIVVAQKGEKVHKELIISNKKLKETALPSNQYTFSPTDHLLLILQFRNLRYVLVVISFLAVLILSKTHKY